MLDPDHPENGEELRRHSPFGQFPLLIDDGKALFETTRIIEHLQACHPGQNRWIPDGALGRRARFLDRFFDLHVMNNMQAVVGRCPSPRRVARSYGETRAHERLHIAYDWLEEQIGEGMGGRRHIHAGGLRGSASPILRGLD